MRASPRSFVACATVSCAALAGAQTVAAIGLVEPGAMDVVQAENGRQVVRAVLPAQGL